MYIELANRLIDRISSRLVWPVVLGAVYIVSLYNGENHIEAAGLRVPVELVGIVFLATLICVAFANIRNLLQLLEITRLCEQKRLLPELKVAINSTPSLLFGLTVTPGVAGFVWDAGWRLTQLVITTLICLVFLANISNAIGPLWYFGKALFALYIILAVALIALLLIENTETISLLLDERHARLQGAFRWIEGASLFLLLLVWVGIVDGEKILGWLGLGWLVLPGRA